MREIDSAGALRRIGILPDGLVPSKVARPHACAKRLARSLGRRAEVRTRAEHTPLRLSKRTEYGLRAVVQLAQSFTRGYVQSKDLAVHEDLPNKFLESILLALRRGGFLESKVGSGGGYRLSRHPREIRVGDIIRRLEGRLTIKESSNGAPAESSPGKVAVRLINQRLTEATDEVLDKMTLEELMEHVQRHGPGQQAMYYI